MRNRLRTARSWLVAGAALLLGLGTFIFAPDALGSEAELRIPDLSTIHVLGTNARVLLFAGMGVCLLGMAIIMFAPRSA